MFIRPRMMRKDADTEVPMMPPTREKESNRLETAFAVPATAKEVTTTILTYNQDNLEDEGSGNTRVEWPNENHVPTVTGFVPLATRRLVMRSIADMWSASRACRSPRVYARTAVEAKALYSSNQGYSWATKARFKPIVMLQIYFSDQFCHGPGNIVGSTKTIPQPIQTHILTIMSRPIIDTDRNGSLPRTGTLL
jgi:hypothetical protein